MKQFLSVVLLLCRTMLHAQITPQYMQALPAGYTDYFYGGGTGFPFSTSFQYLSDTPFRKQNLYRTSEFPTAPSGIITDIFYRAYNTVDSVWNQNFTVRMGYMPVDDNNNGDTFSMVVPVSWYPTDTVFFQPDFILGHIDSGDWIQITLQTPFYYDPAKNFIVDISHDSILPPIYHPQLGVCGFGETYRMYVKNYDGTIGSGGNMEFIALNIQPLSVNDVGVVREVKVYPNPGNGVFTLRFHAARAVKKATLTIANLTGSIVLKQEYANVSGAFSKQIDMSAMPRGIYFAEIRADGERVVKKLVLQ